MLKVRADFDKVIKGTEELGKQLPFAIALTLTKVAQDGQEAARVEEKTVLQNRNDWTVRNTKIKAATKQNLTSSVFTDTENRRTGAPDYMVRQDDGQERVPINGRQHIAIPTKYLYMLIGGKNKIIPDWLRPRAMLAYAKNEYGGGYVNRRGKTVRGNAQTRGYYFFVVTLKSGARCVMTRAVADPPNAALPMYIFVTKANIRKRVHLLDDVDKAVNEHLQKRWGEAFATLVVSDAIRNSGLKIKY